METVDVSAVVLTYNADLNELKRTLRSVMLQEGVSFEIVIADDGSRNNLADEITSYLENFGFKDYQLVLNPENHGTVINVISGVEKSKGKYIKLISPGDYLYDTDSLKRFSDYADKNDAPLVFGDMLVFDSSKEGFSVLKNAACPYDTDCYKAESYDPDTIKRNYLIVDDHFHGVSTLVRRSEFLKYLKMLEGKAIYCEDLTYRLMAYDDVKMIYCPYAMAMYGYGQGISTAGNSKWAERMLNDVRASNDVILTSADKDDSFNKLMKQTFAERYTGDSEKTKKFFMKHPALLLYKVKMEKSSRSTVLEYNASFVDKILDVEGALHG